MKKLIFFLSFLFLIPTLMAQISVSVVQNESCKGHDGVARVSLPEPQQDYVVTWSNGSHESMVTNLTQGMYTVVVAHQLCPDKPVFEDYVIVGKDEGEMKVLITATTKREATCDEYPVVQLSARAENGRAPLSYEWQRKTVSTSGLYTCQVTDALGCKASATLPLFIRKLNCDANRSFIEGAEGYGVNRFVSVEDNLSYRIDFENDKDEKRLPVQQLVITCVVPQALDINSISLKDIRIGNSVYALSAGQSYKQRLDLRDVSDLLVDVDVHVDIEKRQISWSFQSVDPSTGTLPLSAKKGFLLPNASGSVSFEVTPARQVLSGDLLSMSAWVTTDNGVAQSTNVWNNLVDAIEPLSHADTVAVNREMQYCDLTLAAADDEKGSGVQFVDLFVSENGNDYVLVGSYAPNQTARYNFVKGNSYSFITQAVDNVGNREQFHASPDVVLLLNESPLALYLSSAVFDENVPKNTFVGFFVTADNNRESYAEMARRMSSAEISLTSSDLKNQFTYQLVTGENDDDNVLFSIENGQLFTNANFNCDGREYYNIRVRTTNVAGLSLERAFELRKNVVNPAYLVRIAKEFCQGDSYVFGSKVLTQGGVYYDTLETVMGCDSIVELTLYENPSYDVEEELLVCDYEFPMTYAGHYFDENTQSGTYPIHFVLPTGCDSIVTLKMKVLKSYKGIIDRTSICQSTFPFTYKQFKDLDVSKAGERVIVDTFQTETGCDSIVTLYLTVHPSYEIEEQRVICSSELPYSYDSTHVFGKETVSGIYPITYMLPTGCDSTILLSLTVYPTFDHVYDSVVVCQSKEPFTYKKFTALDISQAGLHKIKKSFKTIHDCDSIVELSLQVYPVYNTTDIAETCQSTAPFDYKSFKNIDVTSVGTRVVKDVFQSVHGCDSIVSLTLTVHPHYEGIVDTFRTCQSDELATYRKFSNLDVSVAGTKQITQTFSSKYGCDSTVTLTMIISPSFKEIIKDEICEGESYQKHEFDIPASEVVPPMVIKKRTYSAANGCDSTYVLQLTVQPKYDVIIEDVVCQNKAYNKYNFVVSASETGQVGTYTYKHQQPSSRGCDSMTTLKLTVEPVYDVVIKDEICEGDSYEKNGFELQSSEVVPPFVTRSKTYQAACGCDSTVQLQLTVYPKFHKELYDVTCEGESYQNYGFDIPADEVVAPYLVRERNLSSSHGCDSSFKLNLTVLPSYKNITDRTIVCQSKIPFTYKSFKNIDISEAGEKVVTETFKTQKGCDSTVTLTVTIYPSYDIVEEVTTCQSEVPFSYLDFDNINVSEPGVKSYKHFYKTSMACDSMITLIVTVNPTYTKIIYDTICQGEPYVKHGISLAASEVVPPMVKREIIQETVNHCDSSIILYLTVNPSYHHYDEVTTCQSIVPLDYKKFRTLDVSKAGTYTIEKIFDTPQGCDSLVTLTLHVSPTYNITLKDVVCQGDAYQRNGFNIPASENQLLGTYYYELNLKTKEGCDSMVNLTLRVKVPLGAIGDITGPAVITEPGAYTYTVPPVNNATTYSWRISNEGWTLSASSTNTVRLYVPTPGNGKLSVTAVNECKEVTAYLDLQSSIAVSDYSEDRLIKVFPNPTKDRVEVLISDFDKRNCQNDCYIYVYDMYGKWLATQPITSESTFVDFSSWASGLYLLRVNNGATILGTYKLIKND